MKKQHSNFWGKPDSLMRDYLLANVTCKATDTLLHDLCRSIEEWTKV